MLLVSLATANAKCDWNTLKLQQWNQRNLYKWYVSGQVLDDTCVDYMFMVYDFQTKKIDTVESFRGICEVEFNKKGKYKMYLKVWNKCKKCDTALYREVNIIYFPNCKYTYNLKSTGGKCLDSMVGEMSLGPWIKGDTCWQWYSYIWNGPMLDSLSKNDFQTMSDYDLWMYYDFGDSDLVHYDGPTNSARIIKYKFPNKGNYLIATQWYNKCLDQDTFFFTKISFECESLKIKTPTPTTVPGIKVYPNPADDKVIFTVASTNKILSNTYEVYDSKGKLVLSGKMGGSICVGVQNLPNGVYVVKIGKLVQKFIVKH